MRLASSAFVMLFASVSAVSAGQKIPDYPVQQVSRHVRVIHGPMEIPNPENQGFMNNPVFVITDHSVVVVDPGSSVYVGDMVLRQI